MAEPTDGPWILGKFQGTGIPILARQGPIDVCVATAYGLDDARLIAKARHLPELVEALQAAPERPDISAGPYRRQTWFADYKEWLEQARAALAIVQDEDHG